MIFITAMVCANVLDVKYNSLYFTNEQIYNNLK